MTAEKLAHLNRLLTEMGSVAVAFSGGTDSAFLLAAANSLPGVKVLAITLKTAVVPEREIAGAAAFCKERGIRQLIPEPDPLSIESFRNNPPERCYFCKRALFSACKTAAAENGAAYLIEGSNADDSRDYRPGMRALSELGIRSPLLEAGLTKAEIRALSKDMGLPTWNQPASACLASRIPYGTEITAEKLRMIDAAEQFLHELGFLQVRVRMHGSVARIELPPEQFGSLLAERIRIEAELRMIGFSYICLDLQGYRTGSLNEPILHT